MTIKDRQALVPLGPWLKLADLALVPHVEAEFSPPFPITQLYGKLDGEATPDLDAAIAWTEAMASTMALPYVRWEDCSGGDAKHRLSEGVSEWVPAFGQVPTLDDPRLMDCAVTDPQRLALRPWQRPMVIDGYPVEFRVYYGRQGHQGTSSYYPQRPLPETPAIRAYAAVCERFALGLYRVGNRVRGGFPDGFTADFLVTPDERVFFIEGGPPHVDEWCSASPCCFADGEIDGLALAPRSGSYAASLVGAA